ncbi:hypothetical protein BP6252_13164 [Coleophoma cylindrospora]|uniref:BED-type domain-containing protein n=1 Tax=Coleophoma cylindrospora TaxID=1849047 RepID=A0A3D8QAP7_9HELO|nr:hypothetical protein BP6252_13164 [Coleophoma cylindrospora]
MASELSASPSFERSSLASLTSGSASSSIDGQKPAAPQTSTTSVTSAAFPVAPTKPLFSGEAKTLICNYCSKSYSGINGRNSLRRHIRCIHEP